VKKSKSGKASKSRKKVVISDDESEAAMSDSGSELSELSDLGSDGEDEISENEEDDEE
jgi:hypothetical protein